MDDAETTGDAEGKEEERHKGKGRKWAKLKAKNALPTWIIAMYDKCGQLTGSKRQEQTDLINKLLCKDKVTGEYVLALNDPIFQEMKRQFHEAKAGHEVVGIIEEEAQTRCGGETQLNRAVAAGRVTKYRKNNCDFYCFLSLLPNTILLSYYHHHTTIIILPSSYCYYHNAIIIMK